MLPLNSKYSKMGFSLGFFLLLSVPSPAQENDPEARYTRNLGESIQLIIQNSFSRVTYREELTTAGSSLNATFSAYELKAEAAIRDLFVIQGRYRTGSSSSLSSTGTATAPTPFQLSHTLLFVGAGLRIPHVPYLSDTTVSHPYTKSGVTFIVGYKIMRRVAEVDNSLESSCVDVGLEVTTGKIWEYFVLDLGLSFSFLGEPSVNGLKFPGHQSSSSFFGTRAGLGVELSQYFTFVVSLENQDKIRHYLGNDAEYRIAYPGIHFKIKSMF